jgi:hypothetical protein
MGDGMSGPEPRTTTAWLVVPAFVYVFAIALIAVRPIQGWTVLGAALTALPIVTCLPPRGSLLPWAGPAGALVLGFLVGAPHGFAADSVGMAVFGGAAVASPVAISAAVIRWRHDALLVLPVTFAGVVDLLTIRAALDQLAASSAGPTPGVFALALGQVTWSQLSAFGDLIAGNRSATLPLQGLNDPVFAVLLLLAIVGAFLALFLPEPVDGAAGVSDSLPILVPVLVAVVSAAAFELAADREPTFALLGLAAAALATVAAIRVLSRPRTFRWPRRRPARAASASGEPAHGSNAGEPSVAR